MSPATKTHDGSQTPLTIAGWVAAALALILCVTALTVSGNPLYFVFGVVALSVAGIIAATLRNHDPA